MTTLRPIDDAAELQRLFDRCGDYFAMSGEPPDAALELASVAPGRSRDDTFCFGVYDEAEQLIGFVNLARHFPKPNEWWLAFMLLDPAVRNAGRGTAVHEQVRHFVVSQGATALWLGVLTRNEAGQRFWSRCGYVERERQPYGNGRTIILMSLAV
jgi:GNAT superfamily N-acetyltransferase